MNKIDKIYQTADDRNKFGFVKLKDVCNINMGQSPDSDSYNDNEDGIPFFKEMQILEKNIQLQESGVMHQQKLHMLRIF